MKLQQQDYGTFERSYVSQFLCGLTCCEDMKVLYNSRVDGFDRITFYNLVGGQKNVIVLVKVMNQYFGVYHDDVVAIQNSMKRTLSKTPFMQLFCFNLDELVPLVFKRKSGLKSLELGGRDTPFIVRCPSAFTVTEDGFCSFDSHVRDAYIVSNHFNHIFNGIGVGKRKVDALIALSCL
ncbi:hypothetical protein EIN_378340 [Entamoeba invadens IP1]|uniref:TLDc domain-containing protein n=1 Tax=Entamoeba invadens IP1 TaxID=370355 RepID=A0A0A1TUB0_ENTIV|nr:hypothetical protein EIN_378340 [Entamoeba invadens IP1]ELP83529.1 hypothetical protein EIN_378340 [Entamoeba invadens IP1]|eukprot:XP_004182875.1 hypothetical protein EIN_378340 [Entamoeba invadens IP1]